MLEPVVSKINVALIGFNPRQFLIQLKNTGRRDRIIGRLVHSLTGGYLLLRAVQVAVQLLQTIDTTLEYLL